MADTETRSSLYRHPVLRGLRKTLAAERRLMKRGIHTEPESGRDYYSGYAYKTLYDWDQYFEAIVQLYMGWGCTYIKNGVTLFLDHMKRSGLISRSVPSNMYHDPEHVKPFLAQTALLVLRYYGEADWILNRRYYPRLKRYLDYWTGSMDSTGNGLAEWMSAPHTGMDNHHERAGHWRDRVSQGVDLNCYLHREFRAMATLAQAYGKPDDAAAFNERAEALAAAVRKHLWDRRAGFFFDLSVKTGRRIPVRAISGFAPLWAGIATPEQARRLVHEHLFDPDGFWTAWPAPALAKSEPGYSRTPFDTDVLGPNTCSWRANTWIPTNYMLYHGLKAYGYREAAALLADRTTTLVRKAGNREWYDCEAPEGRGLEPFWGWSLLAHFLPFEEETGENPNHLALD